MTQNNPGSLSCVIASWGIAALAGALICVLLMTVAGFGFPAAAFLGAVAFVIGGLVFMWAFCRSLPEPNSVVIETPEVGPTDAKAEAMAEMAAKSGATTSKKASGATEKAAAAAAPAGAAQATAAPAPAQAEAKAKPKAAPKPKAEKKVEKAETKKPAAKPAAADGKPELLTQAREGGADDLKQIKGVGPKLEGMLNKMGVYHFDQVASWRKKEVAWVDENLEGFKGRVSRDDWVAQAKVLAKGGTTEFSKKVKKGGVY